MNSTTRVTYLVNAKIATTKLRIQQAHTSILTLSRHLLTGLSNMPPLPRQLPLNQQIDLLYSLLTINQALFHGLLKQTIHIQLAPRGSMFQELQNALDPAHELVKQAIIVNVNLMDKFVQILFVSGA